MKNVEFHRIYIKIYKNLVYIVNTFFGCKIVSIKKYMCVRARTLYIYYTSYFCVRGNFMFYFLLNYKYFFEDYFLLNFKLILNKIIKNTLKIS